MSAKKTLIRHDGTLLCDLRGLIEETRTHVATTVNAALTMLYWRIGHRINEEVLKGERAAYGAEILQTVSAKLMVEYGSSFSEKNLRRMIQFSEVFPDEQILVFVNSRYIPGIVVERLREAGYSAEEWTGGTSKKKRAEIKARFMAQETQVIVASVTSISDGTDGLQEVCNIEVWMNKPLWNIKTEQAEGRLNRRGQKAERVYRYELYIPNSADDEDYSINARKALSRSQTLVAN